MNDIPAVLHNSIFELFNQGASGAADGMEIGAAEGHKIAHATHDSRSEKYIYNHVADIYKLDLRTGSAIVNFQFAYNLKQS